MMKDIEDVEEVEDGAILSLKEFLSVTSDTNAPDIEVGVNSNLMPSIKRKMADVMDALPMQVVPSKKNQLCNKLEDLVLSESFICELSDNIGHPAVNETEDEFVCRAKQVMRELLHQKLADK